MLNNPEILSIEKDFILCRIRRKCFVNELVRVVTSSGIIRYGIVTSVSRDIAQVNFTADLQGSSKDDNIQFLGEALRIPLSNYLINRSLYVGSLFSDSLSFIPTEFGFVTSPGFSPIARRFPSQMRVTGISVIDLFVPIVYGQKIALFTTPLFDRFNFINSFVMAQTDIRDLFILVLVGVSQETLLRYQRLLSTASTRYIIIYSLQSDTVQEQYITPRVGAVIANYFAAKQGLNVIIIYNDFQKMANALREISLGRRETPGRRNYPTYMYSELAYVYERCGVFRDIQGSITAIPIIPLENDDINHPLADLTGYITEGQIVITNPLVKRNLSTPIELSLSLSRMFSAISRTSFPGHQILSDFIYYSYSKGIEAYNLMRLVGEDELSESNRIYLRFKEFFDQNFLNQQFSEYRSISQSRALAMDALNILPRSYIPLELLRQLSR